MYCLFLNGQLVNQKKVGKSMAAPRSFCRFASLAGPYLGLPKWQLLVDAPRVRFAQCARKLL
jgi:hypothetical protein